MTYGFQALPTGYCSQTFAPIVTPLETRPFSQVSFIKQRIVDMRVHYSKLLDTFCNMYRDYPGCFFDPDAGFIDPLTGKFQEVFVNTDCLIEAPEEWWRDQFASNNAHKRILKLRSEARPRWQALGSIYFAYHPWERAVWQLKIANDNGPPKRR